MSIIGQYEESTEGIPLEGLYPSAHGTVYTRRGRKIAVVADSSSESTTSASEQRHATSERDVFSRAGRKISVVPQKPASSHDGYALAVSRRLRVGYWIIGGMVAVAAGVFCLALSAWAFERELLGLRGSILLVMALASLGLCFEFVVGIVWLRKRVQSILRVICESKEIT